jgi:hypothetical protein
MAPQAPTSDAVVSAKQRTLQNWFKVSPFVRGFLLVVRNSSRTDVSSAVDVEDFTRHERCLFKEQDSARNVGDRPNPSNGMKLRQRLVTLSGVHGCIDDAWRDRVNADAARRVFDGQGCVA